MIKIENAETYGWEATIRGMRNPMNSWSQSDSFWCIEKTNMSVDEIEAECGKCTVRENCVFDTEPHYIIGTNDLKLMKSLSKAGNDHGKFLRMITVALDITAPLYWWKEFDTYKVGTVANSCSTMHTIHKKEFTLDDFSLDQSDDLVKDVFFQHIIPTLNIFRKLFCGIESGDRKGQKHDWYSMIQLLPSSYNQKRTVTMNYEVLRNMYHARKNHKLDEWHTFCDWIERLPYSEIITGKDE